MKSLRVLKATALVAIAVVLGLVTAQGSYALWNASATAKAGTIQSADFSILINGVAMAGPQQALVPDLGALVPGASSYTSFSVTNNVNSTNATRVKPTVTAQPAAGDFAGYVTVEAAALTGKSCSDAAQWSTTNLGLIDQYKTKTICLKVTLAPNTPAKLWDKKLMVPISLTVAQA